VLGLGLGLVGGLGVAFVVENLSTSMRTGEDVAEALKTPVLAAIPKVKGVKKSPLLNSDSPAEEAFRRLRTTLLALRRAEPFRAVLVTSAEPDEGKSTIAANLGRALAEDNRAVLLVDSNLRRPQLHHIFGLPNETGLTTVLEGGIPVEDAVSATDVPRLAVLTSGQPSARSADLLSSSRFKELIENLKHNFDIVLLDSPALLPFADALVLAHIADAVVLVVRLETRRDVLESAYDELLKLNTAAVGIVLNAANASHTNSRRHYSAVLRSQEKGKR